MRSKFGIKGSALDCNKKSSWRHLYPYGLGRSRDDSPYPVDTPTLQYLCRSELRNRTADHRPILQHQVKNNSKRPSVAQ